MEEQAVYTIPGQEEPLDSHIDSLKASRAIAHQQRAEQIDRVIQNAQGPLIVE